MLGVVFLEMKDGSVVPFDLTASTGTLKDRRTGVTYENSAQVLDSPVYADRVPAYLLDPGSRAGDDNAWCNFKCSGCFRPLQASRWYHYNSGRYKGMKKPQNSLGRFIGSRGTEMDDAGLRPYSPNGVLPAELSDGVCWHENRWLKVACGDLGDYYEIDPSRFN